MAKTYTKKKITNLLQCVFKEGEVYQTDLDNDDEFHISFWEKGRVKDIKTVEVVNTLAAIKSEADFTPQNKTDFLTNVIEALLNEEELVQIGAYTKLADNLFWREL
jgi:hypothetical protein